MQIIIVGDGKVGVALTEQLSSEGHDLTLIDSKQEVLDRALERIDVMAVRGNCASMEVLRQAGIADADLLIAADCTAYAYAAFHERFIKGHITLVGCPKLDSVDYSEKLTEIIRSNDIKSVTVVRMEVPCCGGLEHAAKTALQQSGKFIPWQVVTISTDGRILV